MSDETRAERPSMLETLSQIGSLVPRVRLRPVGESEDPASLAASASDGSGERYEVLGELAKGGVGVVLKARDRDLGRDLAMKVLRDEHLGDADVTQRFVEEAQIGGQLQHPGVVPVYELGRRADKRPYFTMKLVKGRTLAALLRERKDPAKDRRRFLAVFESVCQTLAYAHARGVIHRDVKPSNVMVGAFGEVQVVDWGLGKVLSQGGVADERRAKAQPKPKELTTIATVRSGSAGSASRVGSIMGTPAYMPPEQAMGDVERTDERSDVFGLGAMLCEILTGQPPYVGTDIEVIRAARKADLEPAKARLAACGAEADLVALCEACLAPSMDARPRDASAVAKEVSAHLLAVEKREIDAKSAAAEANEAAVQARRGRRLAFGVACSAVVAVAVGASSFVFVRSDRFEHESKARAALETAMREATLRRGEAEGSSTPDAWSAAVDAAKRADSAAHSADLEPADAEAPAKFLGEVVAAADAARAEAEQRARERALSARVIEIEETESQTMDDPAAKAAEYRKALLEFGLDVAALDPDDAVRRIKATRIAPIIARALNGWSNLTNRMGDPFSKRLEELATNVKDDPLHRAINAAKTPAELSAVARSVEASRHEVLDLAAITGFILQTGYADAALPLFEALRERAPQNNCANCHLVGALEAAGRHDEATRYRFAAVATGPHHGNSWIGLATALREHHARDASMDAVRRAVFVAPANSTIRVEASVEMRKSGDVAGASEQLSAAEQLDATPFKVAVMQADRLWAAGDLAGAERAYASVMNGDRPDVERILLRALGELHSSTNPDRAIAELRRSVALKDDRAASTRLAELLLRKGAVDDARRIYEKNAAKRPGRESSADLGWFHGKLSEWDAAVDARRAALRAAPRSASERTELASALANSGRVELAVVEARRGLELDERSAQARHVFAYCLAQTGDLDRALTAARAAVDLDQKDASARVELAHVLALKGEKADAVIAATQAVQLASNDAFTRNALGDSLCADHPKDAIEQYQAALGVDPRNGHAWSSIAQALSKNGDDAQAVMELNKWVAIDPSSAAAHAHLGDVLARRPDTLEAGVDELRKAVQFDPKNWRYRADFARALYRSEVADQTRTIERIEACRMAIALGAEDGDAIVAEYLVSALVKAHETYDAVAEARAYVRRSHESESAYAELGFALMQSHDSQSAISELQKAIQLSSHRTGLADRTMVFALLDGFDRDGAIRAARDNLRACEEEHADDELISFAHVLLADALGDADIPAVESECRAAMRLDPKDAVAVGRLAWALEWSGKLHDALDAQRSYIAMSAGKWFDAKSETDAREVEALAVRAVELEPRLADVLRGAAKPANARETLDFAYVCGFTGRYAAAADLFQRAFAAEPTLEDFKTGGYLEARLEAAMEAAMAGCGKGKDAPSDAAARARLRGRALEWCRADLAARIAAFEAGAEKAIDRLRDGLHGVKSDGWLDGVRDPAALTKLPAAEQTAWKSFWADVDAQIARVGTPYQWRTPPAAAK
jgi:serine/threonine-protein kinase